MLPNKTITMIATEYGFEPGEYEYHMRVQRECAEALGFSQEDLDRDKEEAISFMKQCNAEDKDDLPF